MGKFGVKGDLQKCPDSGLGVLWLKASVEKAQYLEQGNQDGGAQYTEEQAG